MQPQGPGRETAGPDSWGRSRPDQPATGTPPGAPVSDPRRPPADPGTTQQLAPGWPQPAARGESAERAHGAWETPPGSPSAPADAGGYGRAVVPPAADHTQVVFGDGPGDDADRTDPRGWTAGPGVAVGGGSGTAAGAAGAAAPPGAGATAATGDGARPEETVRGGKSRTGGIAVVSVVVILVLLAGVLALVRPQSVRKLFAGGSTGSTAARLTRDPAPSAVLVPAAGGGRQPSPEAVKAALDPLVGSTALGTEVHVAVLDAGSGQVLYAENADVPITPASTTKVLTAVTALAARGAAYQISTRAVAGSEPGDVVLVGGGDPTLAVDGRSVFPGVARLDQLAAQVKKALGGTRPARVLIDTSLFSGPETGLGWDGDDISGGQVSRIQSLMVNGGRVRPVHNESGGDQRSSDPAMTAGKAFAKLLGVPASTVKRARAPKSAAELGVVKSPPLVQITDWMLQESDNTIAELVGRQVALAAGKPATFDDTSAAMLARLRQMGLPADEGDLYDASGLSRHDGISPTLLTGTLALAASGRDPALTGIFSGLPVAGWSGTLADRFAKPAANQAGKGVVRAKTGTLSGVNAMAGDLVTRDGRLLVFAIMASGSTDAGQAKQALDKVPARLVACGC